MSAAGGEAPKAKPQQRDRRLRGFFAGVAAGAAFAFGLYALARWLQPDSGLILVSVFLIPLGACALAVLVGGIRGEGVVGRATAMALAVVTVLLVGSAVIFHEGAICLAMAAPIFYVVGALGGVAAALLRGTSGRRTSAALLVIWPAALMPVERQEAYPTMEAAVVTAVEIAAPAELVWRHAAEIRDIGAGEQIRTLTHDVLKIPRPVEARLIERNGERVRAAIWVGDVAFEEVVTEWRPPEALGWRFSIPQAAADRLLDAHLRLDAGYLRLLAGGYRIEAVSPTQTRLTLTTSYAARTPLNAYAEVWGRILLGDVHRNILHIVRSRAEARAAELGATK